MSELTPRPEDERPAEQSSRPNFDYLLEPSDAEIWRSGTDEDRADLEARLEQAERDRKEREEDARRALRFALRESATKPEPGDRRRRNTRFKDALRQAEEQIAAERAAARSELLDAEPEPDPPEDS